MRVDEGSLGGLGTKALNHWGGSGRVSGLACFFDVEQHSQTRRCTLYSKHEASMIEGREHCVQARYDFASIRRLHEHDGTQHIGTVVEERMGCSLESQSAMTR